MEFDNFSSSTQNRNPTTKAPLTEKEQQRLLYEYRKNPSEAFWAFLALNAVLVIAIGFDSRHHMGILKTLGYLKGGLGILIISASLILLTYLPKRKKLNQDLQGGFKIIRKVEVAGKGRSHSHNKYYVWLGSRSPKARHEVDSSVYAGLEKGDWVAMEFAPFSNILLHINWYSVIKQNLG
ncbi:MAG TPA: hypothetical protein DCF33_18775 [Saprospirales bacterium]|nr:hypothetical protein [Saprospirales bacterium]